MGNDEYIKLFLKKHNYDGNITVQTLYGNTWDDVVSIICNEKDISIPNKPISIEDIQYDIITELPEDLFYNWIEYCKESNENIGYKDWFIQNQTYSPKNIDNSSSLRFKNDVENAIDKIFIDFENKYSNYDIAEIDDDNEDEL